MEYLSLMVRGTIQGILMTNTIQYLPDLIHTHM